MDAGRVLCLGNSALLFGVFRVGFCGDWLVVGSVFSDALAVAGRHDGAAKADSVAERYLWLRARSGIAKRAV